MRIDNLNAIDAAYVPRHPLAEDLTGQQFERLTALWSTAPTGKGAAWLCQCSCGQLLIVPAGRLKSGATRSCGCLQKERSSVRIIKTNLDRLARGRGYRSHAHMQACLGFRKNG